MDIFTQIYPPEWLSKEEYLKKSSDLHALIIVGDSKSNALKALCIGMNKINVEKKSVCNIKVVTDKLMIRSILEKVKIAFLTELYSYNNACKQ